MGVMLTSLAFIRKTLNNSGANEGTEMKLAELVMKSQGEFREIIDPTVNNERLLDDYVKVLGV